MGCRFCQAGYIYRPTREREPGEVVRAVQRSLESTGYDEFSLTSLNTGEYGAIQSVLRRLMDEYEPRNISAAVSSLHATTLTAELAEQIKRVRKTGFTIAPEGGTQRMRDVINKNLTEEDILNAARHAYTAGWEVLKLYFMIGQPTETDEDVIGIVEVSKKILAEGRRRVGGRATCTLSASSFVPKSYTPFQWLPMDRIENLDRKQSLIRSLCPRGIKFKHHDNRVSYLEAIFSRGDRRLCAVLERAWRSGAQYEGWTEHRHDLWMDAFRAEGSIRICTPMPSIRPRASPWDVVDALVNKSWLASDLAPRSGRAIDALQSDPADLRPELLPRLRAVRQGLREGVGRDAAGRFDRGVHRAATSRGARGIASLPSPLRSRAAALRLTSISSGRCRRSFAERMSGSPTRPGSIQAQALVRAALAVGVESTASTWTSNRRSIWIPRAS